MDITYNPIWDIYDSTKIQEYLDCPRMFFYKRILGWKRDISIANDLQFGKAWHKAMEILYQEGFDNNTIIKAFEEGFLPTYREVFPVTTDELFEPKTPDNAMRALVAYTVFPANRMDFDLYEVIKTEIAGLVPISEDVTIVYKMDAAMRRKDNNKIFCMEHKSKKNGFNRQWMDQWDQSIQVNNYNHALNMLVGTENSDGVMVNGTAFLKTKNDFTRVEVRKDRLAMAEHLWNVRDIISRMKLDLEILLDGASPKHNIMMCFGKNPQSCTKYYGCEMASFCAAWPNPLQRIEEPPPGYVIEHWDPLAEELDCERIDLELKEYV